MVTFEYLDRQERRGQARQQRRSHAVARPHVSPPAIQIDLLAGRLLAACVHPVAAWRVLSPVKRLAIPVAYFAAGYATMLALLELSRLR